MLTIYKASAGSGKTFTLAFEFIKTLLGVKEPGADRYHLNTDRYTPSGHRRPDRHRGIMAITFTNAATEEMKSRIVKELASLATVEGSTDSLYATWLVRDFGCTPEELRECAAKALSEVLYDYGNFNVSTIDSFFQTVLRTFSREVDHQGDYELSLDTGNTVKQSISLMLDELNYSRPANARRLFNWIRQYTFGQMSQGKGYNFFHRDGAILKSLSSLVAGALDETFGNYSDALREYLADPSRIEAFSSALRAKAEAALDPARKAAKEFFNLVNAGSYPREVFNATVLTRMTELLQGRQVSDIRKAAITKAASGENPPAKLAVGTKLKAAGLKPADVAACCEAMALFCREIVDGLPRSRFYTELDKHLGLLDFFGMTLGKLEEYLRENNTVLISHTAELLRRIISDAEMPFIYERLGMKLTNILIDEFQDTSRLQWHNLRPLVANSISQGGDNLIIGDEKQAIYRFRNSDSELLGSVVQTRDFPRDSYLRGFDPADNTNHRSAGDVVRVNNTLFGRMAANLGAGSYGNVVQTPCERFSVLPAYVEMRFFDKESMPATEALLEEMAEAIKRQHAAGYAWRDILILTRKRKEATAVVEFLTTRHPEIKVLSSEALLLSSSAAVRTIISMLKLVERSYSGKKASDKDAPVYASQSDIVMMITRFNYFRAEGYETEDALMLALDTTGDAVGALDREIMAIRAENPANLVALVEAVIMHKVTPAQRRSEYAYIAALQDLVVKHTESPDPSLATFLRDYDANLDKWAIKASADLDAVEVMTIHKSKGLERDCVHIPFGDWELVHADQSAWLPLDSLQGFDPAIVPPVMFVNVSSVSALRDPDVSPFKPFFSNNEYLDLIDSLNIAYVAFTRAARELIVYSGTENLGAEVLTAIRQLPDSDELSDSSRCNLAEHFDGAASIFTLGSPTTKVAKKNHANPMLEAGQYPVLFRNDARQLVSIDDALAEHLDIGGEEDKLITDSVERTADPALFAAAERGNHLHSILAGVRTVADLPKAVAAYASRAGLRADLADEYLALLREGFDAGGATVAAWFDPGCRIYAERSIYDADAPADTDTFRPDRIIIAPDGTTTVVDYKFTTEPRPTHFRQVENYLSLLDRLGREGAAGYLWYPLLKRIIRVG